MNRLALILASLRQRALSSWISVISIALGAALTIAVLNVKEQTARAFDYSDLGYDTVIGSAKGSNLQLVLNTVFHLNVSPGNIPYTLYRDSIKTHRNVKMALPYAVGDNYKSYRIVGTLPEIFDELRGSRDEKPKLELEDGKRFDLTGHTAVLGSTVARKLGMKPGDTFVPTHGVDEGGHKHEKDMFTITGILKPTNSPFDRLILIGLDSFYEIKGHVTEDKLVDGKVPENLREISAIIVKSRGGQLGWQLAGEINQNHSAKAVFPVAMEVVKMMDLIGAVDQVFLVVAILIVIVAAGSILASLYNAMAARRREIALLRALGAGRRDILFIILGESTLLALCGGLLGLFGAHLIEQYAADIIRRQTDLVIRPWQAGMADLLALPAIFVIGLLAGLIPALWAYRSDVANNLNPSE